MNDVAHAPVEAGTVEPSPPPRKSRRKIVRLAIVATVLVALVIGGIAYWLHARHFVSTDDAYVNANTVDVAAQVAGEVVKVYVRDQQNVVASAPLFDIDARNYEAAVAKAEAQLALANQNVQQQSAAVDAARAQLAQRQAEELNARHNNERTQELVRSGFSANRRASRPARKR